MARPAQEPRTTVPQLTTAPMQRPDPIEAGGQSYVDTTINNALEAAGAPVNVRLNGEAVAQGAQTKAALAMLGIDRDSLSGRWQQLVLRHAGPTPDGRAGLWEQTHQEGAGWRVDVPGISGGPSLEVRDLAYADVRAVSRTVTYRWRYWPWSPAGNDARTSKMVTFQEDLEDSGAVGVWWSGVTDAEIEATSDASAALHAARRNIEEAWKEIGIAYRVAQKAWGGPRAEAAKFKFAIESDQVTALNNVTWGWERYVHDLVTEQHKAKDEDEKLRNELALEGPALLIGGYVGVGVKVVAGAAKASRASTILAKLKRFADNVGMIRKLRATRFWTTHGEAARTVAETAFLDGVKDFAGHAAVDPGKTFDEWWKSFVFAGLTRGGGGETAKQAADAFAKRHRIDLSALARGTADGVIGGPAEAAAKAALANDALAGNLIAAPLEGSAKELALEKFAKQLARHSGMSPEQARRAVEPYVEGMVAGGKAAVAKPIDRARDPQEMPELPGGAEGLVPTRR